MKRTAVLVVASLALATFAPPSVSIALADSGPACLTKPDGPTCTVLRPPPAPPRLAPAGAPECIVTVGGLGSDNDDAAKGGDTFGTLLGGFRGDPRYQIHRFGSRVEDPGSFPFETYGAIDVSGEALRDFVRALSPECAATHIVTHSMGGAVADRAFSLGLSSADGVATYIPISGPHNGATVARILTLADDLDPAGNETLRTLSAGLLALGIPAHDITTSAVRDLAATSAPRPPRGVLELRQRLANDEFVLLPDHEDRRVDVRDVLPEIRLPDLSDLSPLAELDGHGGALLDGAVRTTTEATIRSLAIPPDRRTAEEKILILALSVAVALVVIRLSSTVGKGLGRGILLGRAVTEAVRALLPRSDAAWWTSSWPALVDDATTIADKEIAFEKGVVTRLANAVDRIYGSAADDVDEVTGHRVRLPDPRATLVRAILDRVARSLS